MQTANGAFAAAIIFASAGVLGLVEVIAPLDLDARLGLSASAIGLLFAGFDRGRRRRGALGGRWGDRRGRRGPAVAGLVLTAVTRCSSRCCRAWWARRWRSGLRRRVRPRRLRSGPVARRVLRRIVPRPGLRGAEPSLRGRIRARPGSRRGAAGAGRCRSGLRADRGDARRRRRRPPRAHAARPVATHILPAMLDHVGLEVSDYERSKAFYTEALKPLGLELLMEPVAGAGGFGLPAIRSRSSGSPTAAVGRCRGVHVAFAAPSTESSTPSTPRRWPRAPRTTAAPASARSTPPYYGAYVLDPDDNNVEAVCHSA